jgi:hypothetical protein
MSVQSLSWVLDYSEAEHSARLVLISIANHADKYGRNAWPSVRVIGEESKLSERVVRSAISELERIGELTVEREAGPGRSNLYSLHKMHPAENAPLQKTTDEGAESGRAIRNNRPEPSKSIKPDSFALEELYSLYPRKVGKANAIKAIVKAIARLYSSEKPTAERWIDFGRCGPVAWLRERIRLFASSPKGQAGDYTPHPATWFNQSRYLDDDREWFRDDKALSNSTSNKKNGDRHAEQLRKVADDRAATREILRRERTGDQSRGVVRGPTADNVHRDEQTKPSSDRVGDDGARSDFRVIR